MNTFMRVKYIRNHTKQTYISAVCFQLSAWSMMSSEKEGYLRPWQLKTTIHATPIFPTELPANYT